MEIGLGFIGAGNHALHHLKEFSQLPGARPIAVFDVLPERAPAAAARHEGLQAVNSVEDLLSSAHVQAVVIATPAETHLELTRQALEAGKHVLLEKPMADTPEAAHAIAEAAAAHPDLVLLVGHGERFNKAYLDARKAIQEDHLGRPRFISASRISPLHLNNPDWKLGVLDTAIHDMDLMLWLMGSRPVAVAAQAVHVQPGMSIPDHATYQIRFENGALAQGHIGWVDFQGGYPMRDNAHPRLFMAGEHGTLQLDLWRRPVAVNNQKTGAYFWPDDVLVGYAEYHTQISAQNLAFLEAIACGKPLPITPAEASLAVAVAHAAYQCLQDPASGWNEITLPHRKPS